MNQNNPRRELRATAPDGFGDEIQYRYNSRRKAVELWRGWHGDFRLSTGLAHGVANRRAARQLIADLVGAACGQDAADYAANAASRTAFSNGEVLDVEEANAACDRVYHQIATFATRDWLRSNPF
jgi:hypothetical protein